MDGSAMKATHPQKYYFKMTCKIMYYLGMGDCWYEAEETSRIKKKLYMIWQGVSNGFIFIVVLDEILANFRSDLSDKEKNDLMQFSIAQPAVSFKILAIYWRRKPMRVVMKQLLEGTNASYRSLEMERSSMRWYAKSCLVLAVCVYMTLISALAEAVWAYLKQGVPIGTEVVFYPGPSSSGIVYHILRFLIDYHWYHLMAMMLTIDSLVLFSLVTVRYKFQIVQIYFENLRSKFLENSEGKSRRELEDDFREDFVIGIKMHEDALWCYRNVQNSMGTIYSIQVFESVALLVMCLLKMVSADRNMIILLTNSAYIAGLIVLTGRQASLVPTSMFHCGWELVRARSDFRVLAVVALQRSQASVYMTAFGIIEMSYTNFISVLRSSYSFFAVMY